MKKKFTFPLLLSLTTIFSAYSYSETSSLNDKEGPPVKFAETAFAQLDGSNSVLSISETREAPAQTGALRAPAPPLSRLAIYAVGSSNCNWEYMTTVGQFSTTCDHGGAQLRVAVQEIGYGGNAIAWMNSGQLANSKNYQNDSICVVGTSYVFPCPVGGTVVGWMKYYNLDGSQNGIFKFQDTSINAPWNTMYTQISIQ